MNNKLLDISDLHVGMKVNTYELSKIFDTYILLSQTRLKDDGSTEGVIEFIGKKQTQEMLDVFNKCKEKYGRRPMIYAHKNMPDGVYNLWNILGQLRKM